MTDIALRWMNDHGDMVVAGADLLADDGLETAVLLSIGLDRRADDDDGLDDDVDPRGWWGDSYADVPGDLVGSKFWLLAREKQLPAVAQKAQEFAQQALQWLVDDRVASSVVCQATWIADYTLGLAVTINRPNQQPFARQYQYVWSNPL